VLYSYSGIIFQYHDKNNYLIRTRSKDSKKNPKTKVEVNQTLFLDYKTIVKAG